MTLSPETDCVYHIFYPRSCTARPKMIKQQVYDIRWAAWYCMLAPRNCYVSPGRSKGGSALLDRTGLDLTVISSPTRKFNLELLERQCSPIPPISRLPPYQYPYPQTCLSSSKDNVGKRRPIDCRLRRAIITDTFAGLGVNLMGVFEVGRDRLS